MKEYDYLPLTETDLYTMFYLLKALGFIYFPSDGGTKHFEISVILGNMCVKETFPVPNTPL